MHLKQLKLAGFKSFVEPTTIPFPSQLVAVLGPNGCGKSNIIDAVRWVMGESSAKNLRGESMTDVIFNGSSNRKAVGQASVELIFDNRLGRMGGQYGSYQEISVKRVVTRDGDSNYFLNGTRCRRRDITDIFLGTGAGARSYSIIGQGTVSRLVEARPEELRAFLEEAAGISKYKERRRETLLRINHTRENLQRVADISEELDKQLQRLERQAKAAERYHELKKEEGQTKAWILALKWQHLEQEQTNLQHIIQEEGLTFEKHQAAAAHAWQQSTECREQIDEANAHFQSVQAHFYQAGTDIARLEEAIEQERREKQRLQNTQNQIQQDWQTLHLQQEQDTLAMQACEMNQAKAVGNLQELRKQLAENEEGLQEKLQEQKHWQARFETLQAGVHQWANDKKMAEWRLAQSQQKAQEIKGRLQSIILEQTQLDSASLQDQQTALQAQLSQLQASLQRQEDDYQLELNQSHVFTKELKEIEQKIRILQDKGYQLHTRLASLKALLQTAKKGSAFNADHPWEDKPRLLETLNVQPGWETLCEMVLGEGLQAIVVDSITALFADLKALEKSNALFVTAHTGFIKESPLPRLIDKIEGMKPRYLQALDKVYAAESLAQALTWLPQIKEEESIISLDGYWLSQGWLKVLQNQETDTKGLLVTQQEYAALQKEVDEAKQELAACIALRDQQHERLSLQEKQVMASQQSITASKEALHKMASDSQICQRHLEQVHLKERQLAEEQEELFMKLEGLDELQFQEQTTLDQARIAHEQQSNALEQWLAAKATWQDSLTVCQDSVDDIRSQLHQSELQAQREGIKHTQLKESLERGAERLQILQDRLEEVMTQLQVLNNPDSPLQKDLQEKIKHHHELETLVATQKEQVAALNGQLAVLTQTIQSEEKKAKDIHVFIQQKQMEEQALKVKAAGLVDMLTESGYSLDEVIKTIPIDLTLASLEQLILDIVNKINRLGSINLAAIDEFRLESERKQHLDAQYNDLNEALATLDAAIEKMDGETRQRFQMTFDDVNKAFQSLFPRLFGGGRAMLALTCDNLLEAGVLVMAQPPGKRNSTIHLLSGGEKALTAVALVFAIFQLNPSPFCMLDEVDAPLDDVNVGRFCSLVKEMSQFVQFLFITHNKVTMELAEHLIGVTMREPGVSRVVAVDVEQALSMVTS